MKDKSKILAVVNTGRRKEKKPLDGNSSLSSNVPSFPLGHNDGFLNSAALRRMFLSKDRNDSSNFGLTLKYLAIKKGDVEKPIEDISLSTDGDVPLNDFTILTSLKSLLLFLRKDIADTAKEIITFAKGLKIGKFVSGMVGGSGAQIDENGNAEMTSITLRESLTVPKITFNCIDIISGDKANTFAFGTIKDVDVINQIATLDLLSDQTATLHTDDICRGVFHNLEGTNQATDAEDINGFYSYAGFSTSYFSPTEILSNTAGTCKFRYIIQPGTIVHPMKGMNFFAYGNFTDKSRQGMTYETRYYTRRLKNVDTWKIDPDKNISMQDGLLEGLTIGGMSMHGYGTYQENTYLTGATIQFTPDQKNELSPYVVELSSQSGIVKIKGSSVTPSTLSTTITVEKGANVLTQGKAVSGQYVVSTDAHGCEVSVSNGIVTLSNITADGYVDITINCEGAYSTTKRYSFSRLVEAEPAEATVILRLFAYSSVIRRENGINTPSSVRCAIIKTEGNDVYKIYKVPFPYELYFSIDNGSERRITDLNNAIDVSSATNEVSFSFYKNTGSSYVMVDSISIPVIPQNAGEGGGGEVIPGPATPVYRLYASASVIKNDGVYNDPSYIDLSVLKSEGDDVVRYDTAIPSSLGLTVKKSIDGAAPVVINELKKISVSSAKSSVSFYLFKGDVERDHVDISVLPIGGESGQDSVTYELIPSDNFIKISKIGELDVTHITATILEIVGPEVTEYTTNLPSNFKIKAFVDGVQKPYNTTTGVDVSEARDNVRLEFYKDNVRRDSEKILVLGDGGKGSDGESAVLIDLTNELSSVSCDADGKVFGGMPITMVQMFYGTEQMELISAPVITLPQGIEATSHPNGEVRITSIAQNTPPTSQISISATGKASTGKNYTRSCIFTIIKNLPGRDGKKTQSIFCCSNEQPAIPTFLHDEDITVPWSKSFPIIHYEELEFSTTHNWQQIGSYFRGKLDANSKFTKERFSFNFRKDTWIKVEIVAHSELNNDLGYIGLLDTEYTSKPSSASNYTASASGDGVKAYAYFLVTSGYHYIEVLYTKDNSNDEFGDCVDARVIAVTGIYESKSEASFNSELSKWEYSAWSEPMLYNISSLEERIYLLSELKSDLVAPYSDNEVDNYIPWITEELYNNETLYLEGQKVYYVDGFYECLKQTQGNLPTTTYWKKTPTWTREPQDLGDKYTVQYICIRKKKGNVWGSFSTPIIYTMKGDKGANGAMPRYCGIYDSTKIYVYGKDDPSDTSEYRDIVIGTDNQVYQVKEYNSQVQGHAPSGHTDAYWEMASKFSFVAMTTALIEGANIGGLLFKNEKMVSQDGESLIIDGATGEIIAKKANITGTINSAKGNIGGFTITETAIKNGSLKLFDKGLLFMKGSNRIGIGDCFPPSTGIVGLVGMDVVLNIGDRTHVDSLAALSIEVTGGGIPLGSDARQRGLRVITSGGPRDYALDLKGKIMIRDSSHPNGVDAKTEIYYVSDMWGGSFGTSGGKKKLTFINGLLVSVDWP